MNIKQLSAQIDKKLAQLGQQIHELQKQLEGANANNPQLLQNLATLEKLQQKLMQSRDIAWRAHELQSSNDHKRLRRTRLLGIGLVVFSGLGLLGILLVIILR